MNKIFVNVFVPVLDRNFDVELPINLEMKYVVVELQKAINELTDGAYQVKSDLEIYDKSTGYLINLNNIVKYSGIKNGGSIMLY